MKLPPTTALAPGAPHVRDSADLRGVMRAVHVALAPCVALGVHNTGYQANLARGAEATASGSDWTESVLAALGAGRDASSVLDCTLLGSLYFVPLLLIALAVGALWERLFARARGRSLAPGLGVTAVLFTALLPPGLPWWQAALGISFGIVVGKEIFGGTGRNVFNPAVVGLAFLYFAYPADMRGESPWLGTAGTSELGLLRLATAGGSTALAEQGVTWLQAFVGLIPGPLAATSKLGCLLGAAWLLFQRVASWRTMAGVLLGAAVGGALLPGPGPGWQLLLGGLAFGAVFLATDPVTSAETELGRWLHGLLVGALVVVIRVANPLHADGVLLAILLGNLFAPLIDQAVIRLHALSRRRRLERI